MWAVPWESPTSIARSTLLVQGDRNYAFPEILSGGDSVTLRGDVYSLIYIVMETPTP